MSHYEEAEMLMDDGWEQKDLQWRQFYFAAAQIHATLALVDILAKRAGSPE